VCDYVYILLIHDTHNNILWQPVWYNKIFLLERKWVMEGVQKGHILSIMKFEVHMVVPHDQYRHHR
jgi:hypothetical protein